MQVEFYYGITVNPQFRWKMKFVGVAKINVPVGAETVPLKYLIKEYSFSGCNQQDIVNEAIDSLRKDFSKDDSIELMNVEESQEPLRSRPEIVVTFILK